MNKQLTKKNIGIAASAALMATVAFTGSALAAPGGRPQASLGVDSWCEIKPADEAVGDMTIHVKMDDKSSGVAYGTATLGTVSIEVGSKDKGKDFDTIINTKDATNDVVIDGTYYPIKVNLCTGADLGKAINATTTVMLVANPYPSSKGSYTAQCGTNPGLDGILGTDDDVSQGGLKTADYPTLCTAAP